jgi:hypothetical protein
VQWRKGATAQNINIPTFHSFNGGPLCHCAVSAARNFVASLLVCHCAWAYITTKAVDGSHTKVHWGFSVKMKYPTNLTLLFMNMEKMVGGDLEKGLQNLKALIEK